MGVPKNLPAFSPEEAVAKASEMPGDEVVVPRMAMGEMGWNMMEPMMKPMVAYGFVMFYVFYVLF